MPEEQFPLLFFPAPERVRPAVRKPGGGSNDPRGYHGPSLGRQIERLDRSFTELDRVLNNEAIEVSGSSVAAIPEAVLVLKTKGTVLDFQVAIRNVEGMEWLAEFDLDDVDSDDDFRFDDAEKPVSQHIVFSFANHTAKGEVLSLWRSWKAEEPLPTGKKSWGQIFEHLDEIRPWSVVDRVRESGMMEAWERVLNEPGLTHHQFEIEFWHRDTTSSREKQLTLLRAAITSCGGQLIGSPAWIEDAEFYAVKAELPISFLREWLQTFRDAPEANPGPFGSHEIRYLRPTGCSVELEAADVEGSDAEPSEAEGDPLVAVLDGYPMARHGLLRNHVVVHDPDGFGEAYQASQMRHGTAMCSLVTHGQLDAPSPLRRKIVCRPILNPSVSWNGELREAIPSNLFPEELVWRAVHELLDTRHPGGPLAPTVCVINLSVGDQEKPFLNRMSSWARVLDILSWKFHVLFIVSAGNVSEVPIEEKPSRFRALSVEERRRVTLTALQMKTRLRTLLAPAEAMNALTVGAAHTDAYPQQGTLNHLEDLLPTNSLISPISRCGAGYLRSVKPDVLFPGGRQLYKDFGTVYHPFQGARPPGTRHAIPSSDGSSGEAHSRGTSNAAALASNTAGRLGEMLMELGREPTKRVSDAAFAPLLKALIVHGTRPDIEERRLQHELASIHARRTNHKELLSRNIGYGLPDVERVFSCAANRATILGHGLISLKTAGEETLHQFRMPLPPSLSGSRMPRRLTVTLGWLGPINVRSRAHLRCKLEIRLPPAKALNKQLGTGSGEFDHNQIERGTLWHNVYEGKTARDFVEGNELVFNIVCMKRGHSLDEKIPYGLVVTFEAAENILIYEEIRDRLQVAVPTRVRI